MELWQVRVLLLTSHAWDSELKQRLDDKLAAEVVAGSFVIDYSARLGGNARFELLLELPLEVSWTSEQCFCVFRAR